MAMSTAGAGVVTRERVSAGRAGGDHDDGARWATKAE